MPISAEQVASRRTLGLAYRAWMHRFNLSQQVPHDWAFHVGSEGPWNSQLSGFCSSSELPEKRLDPKAGFFIGLARLNKAIAEKDFPGDLRRSSRDRLLAAEPFLTAEGNVADALDFFAMFIGHQEVSTDYRAPRRMSDGEAEDFNIKLRETFRSYCLEEMIPPKEAWSRIREAAVDLGMSKTQCTQFQSVLVDMGDYTAEQLQELTLGPAQDPLPLAALDRV